MLIGVPKEIKNNEYRVGLTPAGVRELTLHGHSVVVETHAGHGIGLDNEHYEKAGAEIVDTAAEVSSGLRWWSRSRSRSRRNAPGSAKGRCCSPICIWRRIPSRPRR